MKRVIGRRGVLIEYWLSDGGTPPQPDTLLWSSALNAPPVKDDVVFYRLGAAAFVRYKVIRVYQEHTETEYEAPAGGDPFVTEGDKLTVVKVIALVVQQ